MTKKQRMNQRKLEARLQMKINARKQASIQARTGNASLSSSYSKIQKNLKKSQDRYGYISDVNMSA